MAARYTAYYVLEWYLEKNTKPYFFNYLDNNERPYVKPVIKSYGTTIVVYVPAIDITNLENDISEWKLKLLEHYIKDLNNEIEELDKSKAKIKREINRVKKIKVNYEPSENNKIL